MECGVWGVEDGMRVCGGWGEGVWRVWKVG